MRWGGISRGHSARDCDTRKKNTESDAPTVSGHPAGQRGSPGRRHRDLRLFMMEKLTEKGILAGTQAGCPRDTRPSTGFAEIVCFFFFFFFCYLPCLLPNDYEMYFVIGKVEERLGHLAHKGVSADCFFPVVRSREALERSEARRVETFENLEDRIARLEDFRLQDLEGECCLSTLAF